MPDPDLLEVTPPPEGTRGHALAARDRTRGAAWWVVRVLLIVGALIPAYYVVTLFQVWRAGRDHTPARASAEVIVVLGAAQYDGRPSAQLAARLDHGLELWEQGVAPLIMVTGGKQPGDRFTEAEAGFAYLVERDVPPEAILREDVGATTFESLEAAADVLGTEGLSDVVLVTDPYHSLRTRLIADEVGLDPSLSPTPSSVVTGWTSFRRHLYEAGGVAVGRVIGFERLTGLTG